MKPRTRSSRRGPAGVAALVLLLPLAIAACGEDAPIREGSATTVSAPDAGPEAGAEFPVKIESCGHTFTYDAPPERVLVSWPTNIATLAALGLEDRVVGYSGSEWGPVPEVAAGVEEISPTYLAPRETVLAAKPDFLYLEGEYQMNGENGTLSFADLEPAKINAYVAGSYCTDAPGSTTIDSLYTDIENLGQIFGIPKRADELVDELRARVADAAALGRDLDPMKAAFVQSFDGNLYALSGTNYAAVLAAVGLHNEFADIKENFAQISPEKVATLSPDAIFVVYDFDKDRAAKLDEIRQLFKGSPAVEHDRVLGVRNVDLGTGAVTVVDVVEQVAESVYGHRG